MCGKTTENVFNSIVGESAGWCLEERSDDGFISCKSMFQSVLVGDPTAIGGT